MLGSRSMGVSTHNGVIDVVKRESLERDLQPLCSARPPQKWPRQLGARVGAYVAKAIHSVTKGMELGGV